MANIDILGIGNKTSVLLKKDEKFYRSLAEYIIIARKTIAVYAPGIRSGLAEEMLRNEDAVSNIAHAVMMADWHFDGRGNIHGFRKQRIQWAIKSYVGRSSRISQRRTLSLDSFIDGGGDSVETFSSRIADKSPGPHEIVSEDEISKESSIRLRKILDGGTISDQAIEYIKMYYLKGQSMVDIASRRGVSRQSVHDLITRAIDSLRKTAGNDDFFQGIINDS